MKCPYCAEQIKDEAIICRYCHRELTALRLQQMEEKTALQISGLEKQILALDSRINELEHSPNLPAKAKPASERWFFLALLIGCFTTIISIYLAIKYASFILLILPELAFVAIGLWASQVEQNRTIKYYLLLGVSIGILNYLGVMLTLSTTIPIKDLFEYFPIFIQGHLVLLITPIFLVALGAFLGEWLESKKPNGRKMNYPIILVEQIVKLNPNKATSKTDVEKLSGLFTALAPLIAAIGGIVIPLITFFYSKGP